MTPKGLTEPQWKLLQEVVAGKTRRVSDRYKPAILLNNIRLINAEPTDYSLVYVTPTKAGEDLVKRGPA